METAPSSAALLVWARSICRIFGLLLLVFALIVDVAPTYYGQMFKNGVFLVSVGLIWLAQAPSVRLVRGWRRLLATAPVCLLASGVFMLVVAFSGFPGERRDAERQLRLFKESLQARDGGQ